MIKTADWLFTSGLVKSSDELSRFKKFTGLKYCSIKMSQSLQGLLLLFVSVIQNFSYHYYRFSIFFPFLAHKFCKILVEIHAFSFHLKLKFSVRSSCIIFERLCSRVLMLGIKRFCFISVALSCFQNRLFRLIVNRLFSPALA